MTKDWVGLEGKGRESWDIHSCPEYKLGQLGPGIGRERERILGHPQLS